MIRRDALKNLGVLTGGLSLIPYAFSLTPEIIFSNLPNIKKEQQDLIGWLCNCILTEDFENFPTPEIRQNFVLTQVNECLSEVEISEFLFGFENFQLALSPNKEIKLEELAPNEQLKFLTLQFEGKEVIADFLGVLKKYSLLHFVTSENYMKNYLKYEFIPGRYLGNVAV